MLQNVRLVSRAARAEEPALASPAELPLEFHPAPDAAAFAETWLRSKGHRRRRVPKLWDAPAKTRHMAQDHARVRCATRERFALLVPGSGALVKLWREDGFARVAEALDARGLKVIIAGAGEAERALAQRIAAQTRAPLINAVGETTFEQLAALFERAALAVGTDSGPHAPGDSPYARRACTCSESRLRADSRPWGAAMQDSGESPARHIVLTSGLACIACNRLDYDASELPAHPCVRLIADRQVLAAIEALSSVL